MWYEKADWKIIKETCCKVAESVSMEGNIEGNTSAVTNVIINAEVNSIPFKLVGGKRKRVSWWNDECSEAIKERNSAMRILRNSLNQVNIINYQRKKAIARKVIKNSKWSAYGVIIVLL